MTMTDVAAAEAEATVQAEGETIAIKVTKGGTINVDISRLPDRIYRAVMVHGLQKLVNRKTKANSGLTPDLRARENLNALYNDTYKLVGSKADSGKVSGPVMTEARRIAKQMVKAEMKAQKIKVSHVAASEITRLANELIDADPSITVQAEANLKTVEVKAAAKASVIKINVDPALVAKAEAKKAKDKATAGQVLSAKQAGKTQIKSKPATK